jgi:hypothetical protein
MQFLKKNYEKILLGLVVVAALGVVAFLPILVSQERQKIDDLINTVIHKPVRPMPPLELKRDDALLKKAQSKVSVDFSAVGNNKVFNPVRWQKKLDGTIFPNPTGTEVDKLEILKISPLYLVMSLESVTVTPGLATHYGIGITHEAAPLSRDRTRKTTYAAMNETTNGFTVLSAEGPEEEPTSVTLELADTGEKITLTKDKPYKRVEGHTADLRYPPENNKTFPPNRRVGDTIIFSGESYKIIDIKESEVVLSQQSNQKTWIKTFSPTPTTAPPQL